MSITEEQTATPPKNGVPKKKSSLTANWDEFPQEFAPYLLRQEWLWSLIDPRRDIDKECGYPYLILPKQYRFMYDREGIGTRVVTIYPDECWAQDPVIYEGEEPQQTPFEDAWQALCEAEATDPLHYLHRVDVISGIGRYGILLLGTDDGLDMSEPLKGINERGEVTGENPGYKLLYLRPFDEMMAHVINYESDQFNPRFGHPVYYHVLFADIRVGEPGMAAAAISVTSRVVHWSRVIHIADNRETSEVFGVPRMQAVFNRLCDVRKILGGSSEMFWKGGFPGYSFELNPELVTSGVTLDDKSLEEQFSKYSNGLQRYLAIVGLQAKSLAPQVADPHGNLEAQLNAIAISIGVPLRIFTGSEQAQLASGQDVRTWNRRLTKRQRRYLTPWVIRPFIERLICFGILPKPKDGFRVFWPDVNMPSEEEKTQHSDRIAAALMKYVMGGGFNVMAPAEFLRLACHFSQEEVDVIFKGMSTNKWPKIVPPNQKESKDNKGGSPSGDA